MKKIPLTRGLETFVDDEDFERFGQFKWYAQIQRKGERFYAVRNSGGIKQRRVFLHREILSPSLGMYVDHIDRNTLNNQRNNLRECTAQQNSANRTAFKGRKFKGVYRRKGYGKWYSQIQIHDKIIRLGTFDLAEEAAMAYDEAAKRLHGEFAVLNFPNNLCNGLEWN